LLGVGLMLCLQAKSCIKLFFFEAQHV